MTLTWFMPRYGTLEHRRLGSSLLALLVMVVALVVPDVVLAAPFNGNFAPDTATVTNANSSFLAWWKAIAVWGLWISVAALVISVLFMGGRFWWVPVCVALICLFGESFVNGVKTLMG